jgi:hypothetical protein
MVQVIQDLRIGTKLAIASTLCILLVGLMIFSQISGNATVGRANQSAIVQQTIARDAIDAKASLRGMQTGVRDLRLANSLADFSKASDYVAARLKSVNGFADEMTKMSRSPETHEQIDKLKGLAGDYATGALQIAAVRNEAIGINATRPVDGQLPLEAIAKVAKLNDERSALLGK